MPALSNLFRSRDAGEPIYRPVRRGEIDAALRMILGVGRHEATDEQVLDFLSFAVSRGINVNDIWIAQTTGALRWAFLPVVSPGRTMLMLAPGRSPGRVERQLIPALHDCVLRDKASDVLLVQMLLAPSDGAAIAAYTGLAGYHVLAELAYLQASVRGQEPFPPLPAGWAMRNYSLADHGLFASAIARTYEGSLDCPSLNGRRDVDDIIAGHKAAGDFDPSLWFVLQDQSQTTLGALLLSRSAGNGQAELVYIGLSPQARGKGVGDLLIRFAKAVAGVAGRSNLSLAVDASNGPALRLYYRHGFARVGSRVALMRDLREVPVPREEPRDPLVKQPDHAV
jgi:mycothiol synthase